MFAPMKSIHKLSFSIAASLVLVWAAGVMADDLSSQPIGDIVQGALADTYTATSGTVETTTIIHDSEFDAALQWMYNTQITRYNSQETYAPFSLVTREQAAKMLTQFFTTYVENPPRVDISNCQFWDTTNADPTLKPFILDACQFSIFKGSNGQFSPSRTLTKAELSAALIRMFSDGHLDESMQPWYTNYFIKAQELGMTKETNINNFQNPVSRYELALVLYRFKKIYADEEPATPLINTTGSTTTYTGTTTTDMSGNVTSVTTGDSVLNLIGAGTNVTDSIEFKETVWWMYDNGLTKFSSTADFGAFDVMTREQAAKMLVQYRNIMFPGKAAVTPESCTFKDIGSADPTLKDWIVQACQLNILRGGNGTFAPTKPLSKPEAIAVLLRMFDQPQDETASPWWHNYFVKANQLGLINESSEASFDKPITRYEMSTLMYRLKVKNAFLNSLNNNSVQNKLITMVNTSRNLIVNTGDRARGYILMNTYLLGDQNSDYFLMDVFGTTYKITKNTIQKYYDKQYVWYGDIYSLDGERKVGIASFMINDTVVLEWIIRPFGDNKPSYILGPTDTPPYYLIKQIVPLQPGATLITNTSATGSVDTGTGSSLTTTGSVVTTGSTSTGGTQ